MSNQNWKKEMVFPTKLTARDVELVWRQCQIQGDGDKPEAVEAFAEAYSLVKAISVRRAFPSNQEEV
jgi:NACalpha-BTF3-like transcription factor